MPLGGESENLSPVRGFQRDLGHAAAIWAPEKHPPRGEVDSGIACNGKALSMNDKNTTTSSTCEHTAHEKRDNTSHSRDTEAIMLDLSRRKYERQAMNLGVDVHCAKDGKVTDDSVEALLVDIGRGGMCLKCRRPMLIGELIFVRVKFAGSKWKLLFGAVRHIHYASGGQYQMGIEFMPIPTVAEYQKWIENLTVKFGGGDA